MTNDILLWLNNNGWLLIIAFYIIYIIVKIITSVVKNKKVDVNMLYKTLKQIPKLISQAELIFPAGSGADKLSYCTNVIKLLITEKNPNSALLAYDWDSLITDIITETKKINVKEDNK